MAAVDQFSSFARSLSYIHLQQQDDIHFIEGRGNTIRKQNSNHAPRRSKSPTSVTKVPRVYFEIPNLPLSASDHARRRSTLTCSDVATLTDKKLQNKRRATVASIPLPTSCDDSTPTTRTPPVSLHKGFRADYEIGETLRSPTHMIAYQSNSTSIEAINALQKHNFAFIKRTDGSFTYSILACRNDDTEGGEECMTFVVHPNGSTKVIRKRHWKKLVRLVSIE